MFTNNNLKVALAGIHRQVEDTPGGHNWASAFAEVPDTKVVAIYDKDQKPGMNFKIHGLIPGVKCTNITTTMT